MLRGVRSAEHVGTKEQSQIHQLSSHLGKRGVGGGEEEQVNSKVSRREDIIKIIADITEIETRKLIGKHQWNQKLVL